MVSYRALRPALFLMPPEAAHRAAISALRARVWRGDFSHDSLRTHIAGLNLSNPVGLAAGFDKNAECFAGARDAGFGFVEIGGVTPRAQPGNPRPRVFRLVPEEALINRLGLNNEGMAAVASRLSRRAGGIVGANIGKNKDSEDAVADYVAAMRTLYPLVDYVTANISSPNTPGLRDLQAGNALRALVKALHAERDALVAAGQPRRPIFVKIAPDNDEAALQEIADIAFLAKLDGLIVGNTTVARERIAGSPHAHEQGGLSGKPLFAPSTEMLARMYALTKGKVPLIGVGGISSAQDAYQKILAGASAVQLYTALVYQGFGLVEEIKRGLAELLGRVGFADVAAAVGQASRP
ncbi:MAG: quinone-dependent dihydroorotate dehydrogenase [Alphaproteobacteria bacterium]